ncbi:MAG: ribonuclease III [Oscillospiraceae bacterium]|nr:ribonuclease III [Oscillospiraceae bacterium]
MENQNQNFAELERDTGYVFKNKRLLREALSHSSYTNEERRGNNNERLEFLGDAVLQIIVSEHLFSLYKGKHEGDLTKLRATVVCEAALSGFARSFGLGSHLLLGKGERATGGGDRPSILCDAFEALLGAIYIDGGMENARAFAMRFVEPALKKQHKVPQDDYKTALQELIQQGGDERIEYVLVDEQGPAHDKRFVVEARFNSNAIGRGGGRSKKEAEQQAAKEALRLFS